MRIQSLLSGMISCLPGGNEWLFRRYRQRDHNASTANARYCYSVWLRHLVLANTHGAASGVPNAVAELGPGDSLGTGLAALVAGANRYYALDVVHHVENEQNVNVFDELVRLLERREDIPNGEEFPRIHTELDCYKFPSDILNDDVLDVALEQGRVAAIRSELLSGNRGDSKSSFISYVVPWNDVDTIAEGSIDMIFSMNVLEHVDDLQLAYQAQHSWLKNGGFMSHDIDFSCHGHSNVWNGHWGYSDCVWRIVRGCRPYLINRQPHSRHVDLLTENGSSIVVDVRKHDSSGIGRHELARRFKHLSDQDLCTHSAFILSTKEQST